MAGSCEEGDESLASKVCGKLPDVGLLGILVDVVSCLHALTCPGWWMSPVFTSLSFAFPFLQFCLAHPDNVFFARWGPPTRMARCPGSLVTAGRLAVPAPCSGMSAALSSIRFLTSGSPLQQVRLLQPAPLTVRRSFQSLLSGSFLSPPCMGVPLFLKLFGAVVLIDLISILVPRVSGFKQSPQRSRYSD
jgi:hypothetical protein